MTKSIPPSDEQDLENQLLEMEYQPPCWLGQQLIGSLFGILFGMFGDIIFHSIGGIFGRIFGAAMGVLATGTAGQEMEDWNQKQFLRTIIVTSIVSILVEWIQIGGFAEYAIRGVCTALGASIAFGCF